MNRIILIGNGFDLAHGLKTSYTDFLDDYWRVINEKLINWAYGSFENKEIIIERIPLYTGFGLTYDDLKKSLNSDNSFIKFKNRFLGLISNHRSINNWVDIEQLYYDELKEVIKHIENPQESYTVLDLNNDFEGIVVLLQNYLKRINDEFLKKFYQPRIKSIIGKKLFSDYKVADFISLFKNNTILLDKMNSESKNLMFLNFNYTDTESIYDLKRDFLSYKEAKLMNIDSIHIHGSLKEEDRNPIIFGYGDELDEHYSLIEKLNDNKYLENIKSIKYTETNNYKRLLECINSGNYQIFIFGHSCGLSDRTLLNTLFEHENCVSIKPFYHQLDEQNDNYSDIVRNISRNFNDKAAMRDKLVNKTYCEPLIPFK